MKTTEYVSLIEFFFKFYYWYIRQILIGEDELMRSCAEKQECPPPKASRQLFFDETRKLTRLYGNEPSTQQYQQRFRNPSYRSYATTVNFTLSLPQWLLHTIFNNQNMSLK